ATQVHAKARQVAVLACLRASVAFQEGRDPDAFSDLLDLLVLARHLGAGRLYVCGLVQFAIEQTAIGIAAMFVPRQARSTLAAAMARLDAMPQSMALWDVTRVEKTFFLDASHAEFGELAPAEIPECLRRLYPPDRAEAVLALTGGARSRLLDLVAAT